MPSAVVAAISVVLLVLLPASLCGCSKSRSCSPHFVYSTEAAADNPKCKIPPSQWSRVHKWCRDLRQNRPSPVQLQLQQCDTGASLRRLQFSDSWGRSRQFAVKNNGHSVQATALSTDLTVSGGSLRTNYTVVQFHFHWGSAENMRSGVGSEHLLVDGRGQRVPTPAELHIVCRRADLSFTEAAGTEDGVAVIGVFLATAQSRRQKNREATAALRRVIGKPKLLATPSSEGRNASIKLRHLLPTNIASFMNYDGAFTTPNCNPVVQWHIFTDVLRVNKRLLNKFTRTFFDSERKEPMVNNFRPVMGMHGRQLRCR